MSGQRNQGHRWACRDHSSERNCGRISDTDLCGCTASIPEGRLCICAWHDLQSILSHILGHTGLGRGERALHSVCTHGDPGTQHSGCHSACRSRSPGSVVVSTAPHTHHPGEHSRPCTADSLFEEAQYRRCNSSHTLCKSSWRCQGSTGGCSSHTGIPQRAGPCLDLGRRCSCPVNHSFCNACCMAGKLGYHPGNAQGSRRCYRYQCGSEPDQCHKRSRRKVLHSGSFCRRNGMFYKCLSLYSVQEGILAHSDLQAAGGGHADTLGRYYQCLGDWPHSAGTKDGSQHSTRRGSGIALPCSWSYSAHW